MTGKAVEVHIDQQGASLHVSWARSGRTGEATLDEAADAVPRWIGSADDLLAGADRRTAGQVLDELASWAADASTTVGLYHEDGSIEIVA